MELSIEKLLDFASTGEVLDIASVETLAQIDVAYNTAFGSIGLPSQVQVTLEDASTVNVNVTWDEGDYDETVEGATYTLTGTLSTSGVTNTQGLVAEVDVYVEYYDDSLETPAAALYQATGTLQGGTSISVPWPTHAVDDVGVLIFEQAPADAAISSISGWEQVTGSPVEEAAGGSSTRLTVYIRRATSASEANVALSSTDHIVGVIVTFRGVSEIPVLLNCIDVIATQLKSTSSTTTSITGVSVNQDGNDVLYIASRGTDIASARYSAEANASLTGLTERVDAGTADGNGGGLGVWTGNLAASGASGTLTATLASTSIEAYIVIAFKGINNYSAPGVQASNLVFSGDRKVAWTKSGAGTLILYNESGTINGSFLPVDGTIYEAGDVLGGGNTVMYVGIDADAMKFTRFSYNTTVAIRAFAYNISGGLPLFNLNTATLNPITPTTPADPIFYLTQAIGVSERDVAHPETTTRRSSKAYGLKYAEINGYRMIFVVMDNNDYITLWKYDQTYILYQADTDDPDDPAQWQFYEVSGEPWPLLPTVGNVPAGVNWHSGQQWCAGVHIVTDPGEVWIYVSSNQGITSDYSFGRAVVDFTGFPASTPSVVFDANPIINGTGVDINMVQGGGVIYDSGISRWIALIPNRDGGPSDGRLCSLEVWVSSDGTSFSKIADDIVAGTPIDYGGFNLYGNPWMSGGRLHLLMTEGEVPNYKARYDEPTDTVYKYIQSKVNEVSMAVSTTEVTDVRIENVIFENDSAACSALWPVSGYITHNLDTYVICSCFTWQAIESGPGQIPIDIRVLTTDPISTNIVNRNAFPQGMTRLMKAHRTHIDDSYASTSLSPYDEITEQAGTVVTGAVASDQDVMNKVNVHAGGSYITFPSSTHDQQYLAVKVIVADISTDGVTRGVAEKPGTFKISLYEGKYIEVELTGSLGGTKRYRATDTLVSLKTSRWKPKYIEVGFIARYNGSTDIDIQLCCDCTLDVPATALQNDTYTLIAQTANAARTGNVTGISDNVPTIGSQVWFEGSSGATEYNWLTHNYN